MLLLAADSSNQTGSIAVGNSQEVSTYSLSTNDKTARALLPLINQKLTATGQTVKEIELFAVAKGPGSFTGIRIAMATMKSLAYATGGKIIGVNSLAAIARTVWEESLKDQALAQNPPSTTAQLLDRKKLCVVINAYRKQFFYAMFELGDLQSKTTGQSVFFRQLREADSRTTLIEQSDLVERVISEDSLVCGPGLLGLTGPVRDKIQDRIIESNAACRSALGAALIAQERWSDNDWDTAMTLLPSYFRGSAAEEKSAAASHQNTDQKS